jgi:Tfp pilus assembly protein PilP
MKLKISTLALAVMLGTAWAQNADVIENTQNTLQNVQKKQTMDQNAALGSGSSSSQAAASAQPAAKAAAGSKSASLKSTSQKSAKTVVAVNKPQAKQAVAVEDKKAPEESKKKEPREYSAAGRRDPFISPVVSHTVSGSGCSTGKRCLAVDQIVLTGIVKSDTGMIAVVVNSMNKAYFLRENDPVFNGYVVKITGDSIIFNQTVEDKLGKPFTREVTKKISTPAV